ASVLQPDGKIVIAGIATWGSNNLYCVARFNADGSVDQTFNGKGYRIDNYDTNDDLSDVGLQSDGKIVVVGRITHNVLLIRYHSDGRLDTAFSGDGVVQTDFGGTDIGKAIHVFSDDKILVAGTSGGKIALARYLPNGGLDTEFGNQGTKKIDLGASVSVTKMEVLPEGDFFISGSISQNEDDFYLAKFDENGVLDPAFGDSGIVTTDFENSTEVCNALLIKKNGKIVQAGFSLVEFEYSDMAIAQFLPDGTPDSSFSEDGKHHFKFPNLPLSWALDVGEMKNGSIILGGLTGVSAWYPRFALTKLRPEGFNTAVEDKIISRINLKVSPNPVHDQAKLSFSLSQNEGLSGFLLDQNGRIVKTLFKDQIKSKGNHQIEFSLNELSSGVYHLIIKGKRSFSQVKLVKL
ncbi:MAG: T9SS type A sorting domain-containing protein, partial [Bacteroidia bacterium]